MRGELERWGVWMKRRRPRRRLEQVDAPVLVAYVRARSAFHSKSTVSGRMSVMRGMGEFLVREGVWPSNPLRWLRGPKLDARMRVRGIDNLRVADMSAVPNINAGNTNAPAMMLGDRCADFVLGLDAPRAASPALQGAHP